MGADDDAFQCIREVQDKQGYQGVVLQPTVSKVAQKAFRRNLARLGPLVLSWVEMVCSSVCSIKCVGSSVCSIQRVAVVLHFPAGPGHAA